MSRPEDPIGVFDSGVGGLSLLAAVHALLPGEDLIYYADSAHFPYGPKPPGEVRARASTITRELLALDAKVIVVACNTATSAAIAQLRTSFDVPFVGFEPALKPAAEQTITGRIALLVTPGTARGDKLAALIDRYGAEVSVRTVPAPGLADRIEHGASDDPETRRMVGELVSPIVEQGVDVIALGCTHYAFARSLIEDAAGAGVTVIEPSSAVARQVRRVLEERGLLNARAEGGSVRYLTSGDAAAFTRMRERLRSAGNAIP